MKIQVESFNYKKKLSLKSPDELLLWDASVAVNVKGFKQLPVAQIIIIKRCNYMTTTLHDNHITGQLYYRKAKQNDNIIAFF